jgi:hypothetical protein
MGKKIRYKLGDVVRIPLEDDYHTYARVVKKYHFAYYDIHVQAPISDMRDITNHPILFVLPCHSMAIEEGRWEIVGHVPLSEKPIAIPDYFMQDIIDPTKLQIRSYPHSLRPATPEECEGLERLGVWAVNHIEDRLNDHFAGRENIWVEMQKLKKF